MIILRLVTWKFILYVLLCALTEMGLFTAFEKNGMLFPYGIAKAKLKDWFNAIVSVAISIFVSFVFGCFLGSILLP